MSTWVGDVSPEWDKNDKLAAILTNPKLAAEFDRVRNFSVFFLLWTEILDRKR